MNVSLLKGQDAQGKVGDGWSIAFILDSSKKEGLWHLWSLLAKTIESVKEKFARRPEEQILIATKVYNRLSFEGRGWESEKQQHLCYSKLNRQFGNQHYSF